MFKILDPCRKKSWAEMPGDERSRLCDVCGHQVHAIQNYPSAQQQAMASGTQRLCILLHPPPLPNLSRRTLFGIGLLSTLRPLWAETGQIRIRVVVRETQQPAVGATVVVVSAKGQILAGGSANAQGDLTLTGLPIAEKLRVGAMGIPSNLSWEQEVVLSENDTSLTAELAERFRIGISTYQPPNKARKPRWRRLF